MAGEDIESDGYYAFHQMTSIEELVKGATEAQNRLVENIAKALDVEFGLPEEFLGVYGGDTTPGEIVRQYLIKEE